MQKLPLIDSDQALIEYCAVLKTRQVIALDTEFLRVRTFYPKPGLFQVNDGESIALIDPLAINQWQSFAEILADTSIVKVLHACDEDIELLFHFLQVEPKNIFDTQVAAAFCGYDFCMGYQRLVKAMFDEDIEKGESRSDWMRRPLSDDQVRYAANDVVYLIDMYRLLNAALVEKQRDYAVKEECDQVFRSVSNEDFSLAYKRVKQAWKLDAQQFSVLKKVAAWRERMMRELDLPRNKIAKNDALMILAQKGGWTKKQLYRVDGLPATTIDGHADELLKMINERDAAAVEVLGRPVKADPWLASFKNILKRIAEEQGIAEKMLSKKAYNEALCHQFKSTREVSVDLVNCWRQSLYREALTEMSALEL